MKIMEILARDAVILDLESNTKDALLAEMSAALAKAVPALDADRLLQVLIERESEQSTGIGEGVAIPHGRIPGLSSLVASFARCNKGIDFGSLDRQPAQLFFLLVAPTHDNSQSLKALARMCHFFRDAAFCKKLTEAEKLEDIFLAIEEEDTKF
jgi:PTS system nitrogen regulatory IIA component